MGAEEVLYGFFSTISNQFLLLYRYFRRLGLIGLADNYFILLIMYRIPN